jgi:chemotaxis signal transduction protein
VIACSDERFGVGDMLSIDDSLLRLDAGRGQSGIVALGDSYYAVGANASSGYREYKGATDAYRNDVIALIFTRLCAAELEQSKPPVAAPSIRSDRTQNGSKQDIATVLVGRSWFAVRTNEIAETIDASNIVPLPFMPAGMIGCVMYRNSALPVLDLAKIAERSGEKDASERRVGQIVVMTLPNETRFGLLVDNLGEIVEVLASRLAPLPSMMVRQQAFADTAIACDGTDDSNLLVVLRAERLYENLSASGGHVTPPTASAEPGTSAMARSA